MGDAINHTEHFQMREGLQAHRIEIEMLVEGVIHKYLAP